MGFFLYAFMEKKKKKKELKSLLLYNNSALKSKCMQFYCQISSLAPIKNERTSQTQWKRVLFLIFELCQLTPRMNLGNNIFSKA